VIRRRRTPDPEAILVTGAGSGLGRALLERLEQRAEGLPPIGLDVGLAPLPGLSWRRTDLFAPRHGAPAAHGRGDGGSAGGRP
jgi:nucleoside-diphosphate-sugar epimerase